MNIFTLMVGILMAAAVFAAFIWSIFQVVQARGALRLAHGGTVVAILAGALAVSNTWVLAALPAGILLAAVSMAAAALERGWSRLLPVFPALFGLALILGLPFA